MLSKSTCVEPRGEQNLATDEKWFVEFSRILPPGVKEIRVDVVIALHLQDPHVLEGTDIMAGRPLDEAEGIVQEIAVATLADCVADSVCASVFTGVSFFLPSRLSDAYAARCFA